MPANRKLKPLYIMDYLLRNTDERHPATMKAILDHLEAQGIPAERKSVYDDIEALRDYGLDIVMTGTGKNNGYYVGSRDFELPELKLLVDSVQSSKFITKKKTDELIRKIEMLAGAHDAKQLQRQVFVAGRIKTMNESIYYNVDSIHLGISANRQIRFRYFNYNVAKEKVYHRDGASYRVSPFALTWDDENYYLVAYDSETEEIRHFRVDKMERIAVTDLPREGLGAFRSTDMSAYARKVFGMYSGEEARVRLRFDNDLAGAVIDRLGRDVPFVPDGEGHFTVTADVFVSPQFFAWVSGFGDKVKILSPEDVVAKMCGHAESVAAMYRE